MMVEELSFGDGLNYMEISQSQEGEQNPWPLTITIAGDEENHCQSYNMNENELFALFNLLYKILKKDYTKKLEDLRQLIPHGDSTEDIR